MNVYPASNIFFAFLNKCRFGEAGSGKQEAEERYSIIDGLALTGILGIPSIGDLRRLHKTLMEEAPARAE